MDELDEWVRRPGLLLYSPGQWVMVNYNYKPIFHDSTGDLFHLLQCHVVMKTRAIRKPRVRVQVRGTGGSEAA